MKILPPSQQQNYSILEEVLEELRLNVIDHLYTIGDALNLYSLNSLELKNKLGLLGFSSISIGKFISLDITSSQFEFISPEFYKMFRKLNQHRGNKMSMDWIFHSAGMMNTLVHSNTQFYDNNGIFGNLASFFEFDTYRDNQFPELGIGDGYIIVPYSTNRLQTLKDYLATNPIIFRFLPAGYTFIFLSDYRTMFNPVLQYDNLLNYQDLRVDPYHPDSFIEPIYWEPFDEFTADEELLINDSETVTITHHLFYYSPIECTVEVDGESVTYPLWRDKGESFNSVFHSRFTDDELYRVPLQFNAVQYKTLEEYLYVNWAELTSEAVQKANNGYESDLNNTLFYKDIWLGDYLVSTIKGSYRFPEYYEHIKGLRAIQNPSYSYASLSSRGESLASQYLQREQKIVAKSDTLLQVDKKGIIADRVETDLFKFSLLDDYSVWMMSQTDRTFAIYTLQDIVGLDLFTATYIADHTTHIIKDCLTESEAQDLYSQLVAEISSGEIIYAIKDSQDRVIQTNLSE